MEKIQTGRIVKIEERMGTFGMYSIMKVVGDDGEWYNYLHGQGFFNHYDGEDHMDEMVDAIPAEVGESVKFRWDFDKTGRYRNISNFLNV